jgi:glycosyltransferase A (GT-A) superfamily protein (DUF2064 family)
MPAITPYWAVAEQQGLHDPLWQALPTRWQGCGDLAARLNPIFARLIKPQGRARLIGTDAPQLTAAPLLRAASFLASAERRPVRSPAYDGGFWLPGENAAVPENMWHCVPYSRADTGQRLAGVVHPLGPRIPFPTRTGTDVADDLPTLLLEPAALSVMTSGQTSLVDWLRFALPGSRLAVAGPSHPPPPRAGLWSGGTSRGESDGLIDFHRLRSLVSFASLFGYAATASYIGVIAAVAQSTGLLYVLFPELGALSHDILTRPHGASWRRLASSWRAI